MRFGVQFYARVRGPRVGEEGQGGGALPSDKGERPCLQKGDGERRPILNPSLEEKKSDDMGTRGLLLGKGRLHQEGEGRRR